MSEWQPIDTIPLNKKVLLAEWAEHKCKTNEVREGWYVFTGFCNLVWTKSEKVGGSNWVQKLVCECSEYDAFAHYPSYWMPLPDDPK